MTVRQTDKLTESPGNGLFLQNETAAVGQLLLGREARDSQAPFSCRTKSTTAARLQSFEVF